MTHATTRRRARRRVALAGGLALAAGLLTTQAAHAAPSVAQVAVDAPAEAEIGAEIDVTVAVTDAADLYAYDLAVSYDPALVAFVEDSAVTPDGGFSDTSDDGAGTLAVAHTRLGASPGLEGDVTLATLTFTTLSDGAATFAVPVVSIVGADEETDELTDAASAVTTIAAEVVPTDDPTDDATDEPTDPAAAGDDGTDDGSADPTTDPTSTTTAGAGGGPLASTGANAAMLVGGAVLLVATGAGILAARRKAVASR
ncbi:cohesin domain-containing protein [Cellulosimicrobium arenosum]|uniref:Cohesin domain-containing protein n=1 Tax=Cellulosimicrobium arenosum TaxID=2708133 RepID=A0A927G730_9MICO|nr:cohesin domain-containing protein [Cellulosimicrobium arenosum]MBD8077749.1 hypothetical protein [Cellulosimicrobium arenosum]